MSRVDIALQLLARGFSVIPLWPKSKQAMIRWTEFQSRRATEDEVRTWFAGEPDANIGIVCGEISSLVVGDVDPRHGGSVADMARDAPSDYVVTTPGGGAHFYYAHPGGRCPKSKPRPGIDFQADGCYVVAPGSYVVTDTYEGEYHLLSGGDFGTPPGWLVARPTEHGGREEAGRSGSGEAWVGAIFRDGCAPGTRNDTLARLAGYFASKLPEDIAAPILTRWVLAQEGTGVTAEEAERTIGSIYAKERRSRPAATGYVVDEFAETKKVGPMESMTLSDFGVRYFSEQVEWLIPEWLPARSISFLVSPPGRFKTMLTFDAAVSIAGGWPFMGQFPIQHPGPVLVIQQEDDYADMARRFSRIFAARQAGRPREESNADADTITGHLAVSDLPPVHIVTERGFTLGLDNLRRLEDKVRQIRPRVVVIDPLYSITSADDFMMKAAKDMMPLKRLRDSYDCGFLIAAHTKKGADMGREGLWGSQFLNAFLETGWQIRDRPEGEWNQIQLLRHFKASGQFPLVNLEFLLDDQEGYKIALSDPEEDTPQDAVLAALAKEPDGASSALVAERSGLSVKTVQRRLNKFQKQGLVVKCDKGYKVPKDTTEEMA